MLAQGGVSEANAALGKVRRKRFEACKADLTSYVRLRMTFKSTVVSDFFIPIHDSIGLLEDLQFDVIEPGRGMVITDDLLDLLDLVGGEIDFTQQSLGDRRTELLLGFTVVVTEFFFRGLDPDVMQQRTGDDDFGIAIGMIRHNVLGMIKNAQRMLDPAVILAEKINQTSQNPRSWIFHCLAQSTFICT